MDSTKQKQQKKVKEMKTYKSFKPFSKEQAYWERNQLILALSKLYPSWLELHPLDDEKWEKDWRHIVFIEIPCFYGVTIQQWNVMSIKQLSWHIHDSEVPYFSHLELKRGNSWDGHTTEEKYERLLKLRPDKFFKRNMGS